MTSAQHLKRGKIHAMLSQNRKTKRNEILWHSFKRTHHSNGFDATILLQQYTQNEQFVVFQGHRPKKSSRDKVTNEPEIKSETQERVFNSIRDGCHDKTLPKISRFLFVCFQGRFFYIFFCNINQPRFGHRDPAVTQFIKQGPRSAALLHNTTRGRQEEMRARGSRKW